MLVGIVGKARAGKDTFALMLAESLFRSTSKKYVLMAFAHELKLRVQSDFDLSYEQLWGDEKEKNDLRYAKRLEGFSSNPADYWCSREILQSYGEFYRTIDYDFWVKKLFEVIDDREYKDVIITDVRYINEADYIVKRGGILIKVVRDSNNVSVRGQNHISETALDNYNDIEFTIENDGDLNKLKEKSDKTVKTLIDRQNK